ncbi:MAG: aminotransferase class IV [Dongiaceae bacterium]
MIGSSAIWSNRAAGEGRIDSSDRGFLLGDGVFDTLTAFNNIPFEGERHLTRLVAHAAAIGIELDPAVVKTGWQSVLGQSAFPAAVLRTTVSRGVAARGLWPSATTGPTIVVTASPWSPRQLQGSVSIATSDIRRNEKSPTSQLKSLGYLDNILAARDAKARGADDALLLNGVGAVACTTIANLFAIRDGRLITPPGGDGVLAGVTRGLVLEFAAAAGLAANEESLTRQDLDSAAFVFLTNSVRLLVPVGTLDGQERPITPPAAFRTLRAAMADRVAATTGYALAWSDPD